MIETADVPIYKITTLSAWTAAVRDGALAMSADDTRDGFVHLSAGHQVVETARRYFTGRPDLMLVAFRPRDLAPNLRWEASRGGELFPHNYAPLPAARALWARPLPLDGDGLPQVAAVIAAADAGQPAA